MPTAPFWYDASDAWDRVILAGRPVPGLARVQGRAGRKIDTRSPPGSDGARVRDKGYEPAQIEIEVRVWTEAQLEELSSLLETVHPRRINPVPATRSSVNRRQREAEEAVARFSEHQMHGALNPSLATDSTYIEERDRLAREAGEASRLLQEERTAQRRPPPPSRTPVDIAHPALAMLGVRSVYITGVSVPELAGDVLTVRISAVEWTPAPTPAPRPTSATAGGGIDNVQTAFDRRRTAARPAPSTPSRLQG